MAEPTKNIAYEFIVSLTDFSNPVQFKINPTIEAGDFQISIDGGAFVNLETLPIVQPAGSDVVKVNLSVAEMSGDKIIVRAKDVNGNEWEEVSAFLDLPSDSPEPFTLFTSQTFTNPSDFSDGEIVAISNTIVNSNHLNSIQVEIQYENFIPDGDEVGITGSIRGELQGKILGNPNWFFLGNQFQAVKTSEPSAAPNRHIVISPESQPNPGIDFFSEDEMTATSTTEFSLVAVDFIRLVIKAEDFDHPTAPGLNTVTFSVSGFKFSFPFPL